MVMTTRRRVVTSSRLAGQVARYHTWPTLQSQSNGEHTWQVLRIYWEIFGPPSLEVTARILWHDAGELAVGDLPFPTKAYNPQLKAIFDAMEDSAVRTMLPDALADAALADVSPDERLRIKICDLLDMWEFGQQEMFMGNRYAEPIVRDTSDAIMKMIYPDGEDVPLSTSAGTLAGAVLNYMRRKELK